MTPSAHSSLADWFPPQRHGLVFGIYGVGAYLGLGSSFVIGGELIRRIGPGGDIIVPWIGAIHSWRLVFLAVGLPGLLVAGWAATLPEPARQRIGPGGPTEATLAEVYSYFRAQWGAIVLVNLCVACAAMAAYSLAAWIPSFFIRTYGWTAPQIASRFGLILAFAGSLGYITSGWAGDALVRRGVTLGRINIIVAAALAAVPLTVAAPLMAGPWHALELYGVAIFVITMATGLAPAAQLTLVPPGMRGMAIALGVLTVNLLGLGVGPTAIALVNDYVIGDESQIRYALATMPAAMLLLCALLGVFCLAPCTRCIDQLR